MNIDPALSLGHLWAALAHTELCQHDEAIHAGLRAVQFSETSATLSVCAYVLARAERREEAELILERLTTAPPYGYVSPLQLAVIAEALGRREEAVVQLDRARVEKSW